MNRKAVKSSNISSIGYDMNTAVLEIEFTSKETYQFLGIPKAVYEGLMAARSHGAYFNQKIKDKFKFRKL